MTVDITPLIAAAIQTILPLALLFVANVAFKAAWPTIVKYLGEQNAQSLQARVNEVLSAGIGFAVQKAATTVQSHGAITVDTKNWMVGEAVQYASNHAPDLMREVGGVTEKVLARFDTHPAVQGLVAVTAPVPAAA